MNDIDGIGKDKTAEKKVTPYSKIPEGLVFDDKVSSAAKLLYAAYFKFSPQKDLDLYAWTFAGQRKMAECLRIDRTTVSRLVNLLERERWIEIIKRGQGRSQITVLLPEKGMSLLNEDRQRIRSTAEAVIRQYRMDKREK